MNPLPQKVLKEAVKLGTYTQPTTLNSPGIGVFAVGAIIGFLTGFLIAILTVLSF